MTEQEESLAASLLAQPFPEEPPSPRRGSLELGQNVSTGQNDLAEVSIGAASEVEEEEVGLGGTGTGGVPLSAPSGADGFDRTTSLPGRSRSATTTRMRHASTMVDATSTCPADAPPFRITLSPARDMESTSYESRFYIFAGNEDCAARRAMALWLFEDDFGAEYIERLSADEIVLYTREGVKVEHCSFLRPRDELLVAVRSEVPPPRKRAETQAGKQGADEADNPAAQRGPRVVTCSFFINNLKKVDAIEGTVELDFQLYAQWVDPALAGVPVEERPPYREDLRRSADERPLCWNPKLEVNNDVNLETLWDVFPPAYQGVEEGRVVWGARYRGAISNDMDLRQFPLDSDDILIRVGPKEYTDKDVMLEIDTKKHGGPDASGDRIKSSNLEEWELGAPSVRLERSGPTGSGNYYSNIVFCVYVHRKSAYYFYKIMLIILLLVVISEFTFFMDVVEDFPDRLNTSITLILASVAFLYVASESLPKISYLPHSAALIPKQISYLTLLDKMMLFSFIMLFITALEAFAAYVLAVRCGLQATARAMDALSALLYPACYGLFAYYLGAGASDVRAQREKKGGGGAASEKPDDKDEGGEHGCCARLAAAVYEYGQRSSQRLQSRGTPLM